MQTRWRAIIKSTSLSTLTSSYYLHLTFEYHPLAALRHSNVFIFVLSEAKVENIVKPTHTSSYGRPRVAWLLLITLPNAELWQSLHQSLHRSTPSIIVKKQIQCLHPALSSLILPMMKTRINCLPHHLNKEYWNLSQKNKRLDWD
jgi:hypothetical protein